MNSHSPFPDSHAQKGFTLIELAMVLAIFAFVMGVILTIFVSVIRQQRYILAEQEMLNQVSYVQEYMSRAIRSSIQDVSGSCLFDGTSFFPGGNYLLTHYNAELATYEGIMFISKDNVCQEFYFDRNDNRLKEVKDGGTAQNILSDTYPLKYALFVINGDRNLYLASVSDLAQPRISFSINVENTAGGNEKVFQTTVSARNLNVQ